MKLINSLLLVLGLVAVISRTVVAAGAAAAAANPFVVAGRGITKDVTASLEAAMETRRRLQVVGSELACAHDIDDVFACRISQCGNAVCDIEPSECKRSVGVSSLRAPRHTLQVSLGGFHSMRCDVIHFKSLLVDSIRCDVIRFSRFLPCSLLVKFIHFPAAVAWDFSGNDCDGLKTDYCNALGGDECCPECAEVTMGYLQCSLEATVVATCPDTSFSCDGDALSTSATGSSSNNDIMTIATDTTNSSGTTDLADGCGDSLGDYFICVISNCADRTCEEDSSTGE